MQIRHRGRYGFGGTLFGVKNRQYWHCIWRGSVVNWTYLNALAFLLRWDVQFVDILDILPQAVLGWGISLGYGSSRVIDDYGVCTLGCSWISDSCWLDLQMARLSWPCTCSGVPW